MLSFQGTSALARASVGVAIASSADVSLYDSGCCRAGERQFGSFDHYPRASVLRRRLIRSAPGRPLIIYPGLGRESKTNSFYAVSKL